MRLKDDEILIYTNLNRKNLNTFYVDILNRFFFFSMTDEVVSTGF